MALALVRLAGRRCFSSAHSQSVPFESLCREKEELLPVSTVTKRVLKYLLVDHKDVQQVLSAEEIRPLPYKTLFAPQQVHRLSPLVQWTFQQLMSDPKIATAVFTALEPHANMARGAAWQQYYRRQFFLSGAPMQAYLLAYKHHKELLGAVQRPGTAEGEEGEIEEEVREHEEKGGDDGTQKKKDLTMDKTSILSDTKEWDWVPLHIASTVVNEFCFRGRFVEAIEAYASLPLSNTVRQKVVTILQDYEQYPSVLGIFDLHRASKDAGMPLDVALELDALKKVGRIDEMDTRFQELPAKEQSRADIQNLMEN
uniref:Uncharacterized protein n=1 Tax=Hyaloperonospora arabidopsidis (strain Emoy2) TaxID=559515 RepID=M4BRL8_HYAAE